MAIVQGKMLSANSRLYENENHYLVELALHYSNPSVLDILAHAAEAVTRGRVEGTSSTSHRSAYKRWRVVDRLGDEAVAELMAAFVAGATREVLAERYGVSLSSVKRCRNCAGSVRRVSDSRLQPLPQYRRA